MNAQKRLIEVGLEVGKSAADSGGPRDQHIVETRPNLFRVEGGRQSPQSPAHAIAHDRSANLLRYGVAETCRFAGGLGLLADAGLQNEGGSAPATAASDPEEFAAFLERRQCHGAGSLPDWGCAWRRPGGGSCPPALCRQALAALGAAAIDHADAACGQHALAEAVATLADEPARLISALHDTAPVPVAKLWNPANLAVARRHPII